MGTTFRSSLALRSVLASTQIAPRTFGSRQLSLMQMKPYDFVDYMKENGMQRCFVVYDNDKKVPTTSNDQVLGDLKMFCENEPHDYKQHEGAFLEIGKRSGSLLGAFVWRTNRGQSCGGIRLWEYDTVEEYIKDGLRLSYGMGVKSALAGLWAGGGKGVIASPSREKINDANFRRDMFLDYGDFLTSLNGCYVAAEDAGVVVDDLDNVFQNTRFLTCISEGKGGSGNPSVATGKGIVCGMEAALHFLNMGTIEGKSVVTQGVGNVARVIIDTLLDKNVGHIYGSDCNEEALDAAEKMFAHKNGGRLQLQHVEKGEVGTLSKPCDILSPNALGNVLTEQTIPLINASIVCGAANNQLGKPSDNELMKERGITYAVDFLVNRMGIVNCANEAYGRLQDDPALTQHFGKEWEHSIWNVLHHVLRTAREKDITPVDAAAEIAEGMSVEWHPIWPQRSQHIIRDLVNTGWCSKE